MNLRGRRARRLRITGYTADSKRLDEAEEDLDVALTALERIAAGEGGLYAEMARRALEGVQFPPASDSASGGES